VALQDVIKDVSNITTSIGQAGLNSLFPNDFEYYLVALELVTSNDETVEYFLFPVTPNIQKTSTNLVNVKKTAYGVTTLSSQDFNPNDIVLNGNFGRNLKIFLGGNQISLGAIQYSTKAGVYRLDNGIKNKIFNPTIKTGYGAIKVLQSIHEKSNSLDKSNKPFRLYFYNPALGESYLVKSISLSQNQSLNMNMIWSFSLNLKIIGHLDTIKKNKVSTKSLMTLLRINEFQKIVNGLVRDHKQRVNLLRP
jgi:hypothetical protein